MHALPNTSCNTSRCNISCDSKRESKPKARGPRKGARSYFAAATLSCLAVLGKGLTMNPQELATKSTWWGRLQRTCPDYCSSWIGKFSEEIQDAGAQKSLLEQPEKCSVLAAQALGVQERTKLPSTRGVK